MDLLSHHFLSHFPAVRGAELAKAARSVRFPDQAVIFEEGAPSDAIYLILTGRVLLTKRNAGGGQQSIARLGPDNYFGELGVLDGSGPRRDRDGRCAACGTVIASGRSSRARSCAPTTARSASSPMPRTRRSPFECHCAGSDRSPRKVGRVASSLAGPGL